MLRKILSVMLCLMLTALLCGCNLINSDTAEFLSAPSLPSELKPIAQIIESSADGNYILKYPSRGEYRSAVISYDINNDARDEYFAFYYTSDAENGYMNINAIVKNGDKWKSVATQKIVAGGIDKVEFCDVNNDGKKEILVGWQVYGTSEMQLAVYSLTDDSLTQILLQRYTHFVTCDLNSDKTNEVLVLSTDSIEAVNFASLYSFDEDKVLEITSCPLDSTSKTFEEPIVSVLSTGKPAVYIEEIKGVGAVTEVLLVENNVLKNPLYSQSFKETFATLRSVALSIKDINNDGVLEIPIQENVPSVAVGSANELLYLTSWCTFDGENLTVQQTSMVNINDGYSFIVPVGLIGKIAILKDTDGHERSIFIYNNKDLSVGDRLVSFKSFSLKEWEEEKTDTEFVEIMRTDSTVHTCSVTKAGQNKGLTIEQIKANFSLYE